MSATLKRDSATQSLRRRNLRTGWALAAIAFGIALSIWYSRVA